MAVTIGVFAFNTVQQRKARRANRRAQREQRRLQKLKERRERQKVQAQVQRERAQAEAELFARGASVSSAGTTVPGSIVTQGATQQGFLNQVSQITGNIQAFNQQAQDAQQTAALASSIGGVVQGAQGAGLFASRDTPAPIRDSTPEIFKQ